MEVELYDEQFGSLLEWPSWDGDKQENAGDKQSATIFLLFASLTGLSPAELPRHISTTWPSPMLRPAGAQGKIGKESCQR